VKLLLDMNLPPTWVEFLLENGTEAVHWSAVGDPRAPDIEVLAWALANECVLFTHDLDISVLLALSGAKGPSVMQVRTLDVTPSAIGGQVLRLLREHHDALGRGAIVTLDHQSNRLRLLPISQGR